MAPRGSSADPKVTALRESRCLNPHPEQVTDEAFLADAFFDARDAVQVKYEMVRRVSVDGAPVTATAAAFRARSRSEPTRCSARWSRPSKRPRGRRSCG